MAKKIRFPLEMEEGIQVRSVEELQEHFSIERVLAYIANGKMLIWLRDRYEDELAEKIEALDPADGEFAEKVCDILGVPYKECENIRDVSMEQISEHERKLALLKEQTSEQEFLNHADDVAFSQEEMIELLDAGKKTVYLCGEQFEIPLARIGITYIGINQPTAVIPSTVLVEWEKLGITLNGLKFDDMYEKISDENVSSTEKKKTAYVWIRENYLGKKECGIYQMKESEFVLVQKAETNINYIGDTNFTGLTGMLFGRQNSEFEYKRGIVESQECIYLLRRSASYKAEIVEYNIQTQKTNVVSDLGNWGDYYLLYLENQRFFIMIPRADNKTTSILIASPNTNEKRYIRIPYYVEKEQFVFSNHGDNAYFIAKNSDNIDTLMMLDINKETTTEIFQKNGIRNLVLWKNQAIVWGGENIENRESRRDYFLCVDLTNGRAKEIYSGNENIYAASVYKDKIIFVSQNRDCTYYFKSLSLLESYKIECLTECLSMFWFGVRTKLLRYSWIQDDYYYIGEHPVFSSTFLPPARLRLSDYRLEKMDVWDMKYITSEHERYND